MIIDILTKDNKKFFSNNERYTIVHVPILCSGEITRNEESKGGFSINMCSTLVNKDKLPEAMFALIEYSEVLQKSIYEKVVVRIVNDESINKFNFQAINDITFIAINIIENNKEVHCIDSSGEPFTGIIREEKYVVSGNAKIPLANILIIE